MSGAKSLSELLALRRAQKRGGGGTSPTPPPSSSLANGTPSVAMEPPPPTSAASRTHSLVRDDNDDSAFGGGGGSLSRLEPPMEAKGDDGSLLSSIPPSTTSRRLDGGSGGGDDGLLSSMSRASGNPRLGGGGGGGSGDSLLSSIPPVNRRLGGDDGGLLPSTTPSSRLGGGRNDVASRRLGGAGGSSSLLSSRGGGGNDLFHSERSLVPTSGSTLEPSPFVSSSRLGDGGRSVSPIPPSRGGNDDDLCGSTVTPAPPPAPTSTLSSSTNTTPPPTPLPPLAPDDWRATSLPYAWSCPPENEMGVFSTDSAFCQVVSPELDHLMSTSSTSSAMQTMRDLSRQRTAMVVANRSLPSQFPKWVDRSSSSLKTDLYYFEVTIQSGTVWVGLVPLLATLRLPKQQQHPYAIVLDACPGKIPGSIGLGTDGRLLVSGGAVASSTGKRVYGMTAKLVGSFTRPFGDGDVIGCGLDVESHNRVLFSRNGRSIDGEGRLVSLDRLDAQRKKVATGLSRKNWSPLIPAVGLLTEGSAVTVNFGRAGDNSKGGTAEPFMWDGEGLFTLLNAPTLETTTGGSFVFSPSCSPREEEQKEEPLQRCHSERPGGSLSMASEDAAVPAPQQRRAQSGAAAPLPPGGMHRVTTPGQYVEQARSTSMGAEEVVLFAGTAQLDDGSVQAVNVKATQRKPQQQQQEEDWQEMEDYQQAVKDSLASTQNAASQQSQQQTMTQGELEEAKEMARELRSYCTSSSSSSSSSQQTTVVGSLLELCRSNQKRVMSMLSTGDEEVVDIMTLLDLNELLLSAIGTAEAASAVTNKTSSNSSSNATESATRPTPLPPPVRPTPSPPPPLPTTFGRETSFGLAAAMSQTTLVREVTGEDIFPVEPNQVALVDGEESFSVSVAMNNGGVRSGAGGGGPMDRGNSSSSSTSTSRGTSGNGGRTLVDIASLVEKEDIFSLICELRAQRHQSLLAAEALMKLAKDEKNVRLRDEIRSSGGMHSLLNLFQSDRSDAELKIVAALAVAFLLPSFPDPTVLSVGSLGLRVADCLRYLVSAAMGNKYCGKTPRNQVIKSAMNALTFFWIHSIQPMLGGSSSSSSSSSSSTSAAAATPKSQRRRRRHYATATTTTRRRSEEATPMSGSEEDMAGLMESAVSLIVALVSSDRNIVQSESQDGFEIRHGAAMTIESICAVERARPIAVRDGVLKVLVRWLTSGDVELTRSAVQSLRDLSSPEDLYMAGWIHSQLVSEGGIPSIVQLSATDRRDIRLAVAQILSSLAVAPHTRAAIIDAHGVRYIVQLLMGSSGDEALALASGSAVVRLLNTSVGNSAGGSAAETRDEVISDVLDEGAVDLFVSMAKSRNRGKLRLLAIEAIRLLTEDNCSEHGARDKIWETGAAAVVGAVLRQDTGVLRDSMKKATDGGLHRSWSENLEHPSEWPLALHELVHALHALANIIDLNGGESAEESALSPPKRQTSRQESGSSIGLRSESFIAPVREEHVKVCIQTAESGGVESLLWLSSLPLASTRLRAADDSASIDTNELLFESCRSLASLGPLLLSPLAAQKGFAKLATPVLLVLTGMLKRKALNDNPVEREMIQELQWDALRGLCSLAEYQPLKRSILDESLHELLHLRNSVVFAESLSQAANDVCLALGFNEDVVDMQLASNDPKIILDWFCLEHAMLLQAMARDEIRLLLFRIWKGALRHYRMQHGGGGRLAGGGGGEVLASIEEGGTTTMTTAADDVLSRSSSRGDYGGGGEMWSSQVEKEDLDALLQCFRHLGNDRDSVEQRRLVLEQYASIFDEDALMESAATTPSLGLARASTSGLYIERRGGSDWRPQAGGGLHRHLSERERDQEAQQGGGAPPSGLLGMFPFSGIGSKWSERKWILNHQKFQEEDSSGSAADLTTTTFELPARVEALLEVYFPSPLLRAEILPLQMLSPRASFSFRALTMPQRRYFSFRREGQMVSRICEKYAEDSVVWTMSFCDSSFAGEFAETLVQALYRCPMIRSLSFCRSKEGENDSSTLLANLAGTLPQWISSLCFDNYLHARSMLALICILETLRQLAPQEHAAAAAAAAGAGSSAVSSTGFSSLSSSPLASSSEGAQGTFQEMAIRNSPQVQVANFVAFFRLLGYPPGQSSSLASVSEPPLRHLKVLDLSGNHLGDEGAAALLEVVFCQTSRCGLESLDLSRNQIRQGQRVQKVLRDYVDQHRQAQLTGIRIGGPGQGWSCALRKLVLAGNALSLGTTALEIAAMLKNDALELVSLDLSQNGLVADENFLEVLSYSLMRNRCLVALHLSGNSFRTSFVDELLSRIYRPGEAMPAICFFSLKDNDPPLTASQKATLQLLMNQARQERWQTCMQGGGGKDNDNGGGTETTTTPDELAPNALVPSMEYHTVPQQPRSHNNNNNNNSSDNSTTPPFANMLTVLFSAPLVWRDGQSELHPIEMLDFELERELLWQCFKEASVDIELSFDNATTDRLQAIMTKCCRCLHFSGHGHQNYLTFEDGRGGLHCFGVNQLKNLISNGVKGGGAPFQFVFVSACHSGLAGKTFVDAGVPHVVCCQQESQLMDSAALVFTRAFYLALAIGRTVRDSFEIGRQAVAVAPSVPNSEEEMKKFVLLPEGGNHNVPVFNAEPLSEWPRPRVGAVATGPSRRSMYQKAKSNVMLGSARDFQMSLLNMTQEQPLPTPPQGFLGREADMYDTINAILTKRLVSLIGQTGIGRSSLAAAICQYMNDRRSTMITVERIFFVRTRQKKLSSRKASGERLGAGVVGGGNSFLVQLHEQLVTAEKATRLPKGAETEDVMESIFAALGKMKALLVFDRLESLEGTEEADEFPLFLRSLFLQTKSVRVLTTARRPLGLSSLGGVGEHLIWLGPLNLKSTVRLFSILCPLVHTGEVRKRLLELLVNDDAQGQLCCSEFGLTERSQAIFAMLGDGVPSKTFSVAYSMSKPDYDKLRKL